MRIITMRRVQVMLGIALVAPLSACGGGGGSSRTVVTPPTVVTTSQEDKFGSKFGQDFRADPNSEPATVADGDIVPIDGTDEPISIVG